MAQLSFTVTTHMDEHVHTMYAAEDYINGLDDVRSWAKSVNNQVAALMAQQTQLLNEYNQLSQPPLDPGYHNEKATRDDFNSPLMFPNVDPDAERAALQALQSGNPAAIESGASHARAMGSAYAAELLQDRNVSPAVMAAATAYRGQRWHDRTAARAMRAFTDIRSSVSITSENGADERAARANKRMQLEQQLQEIANQIAEVEKQGTQAKDALRSAMAAHVPFNTTPIAEMKVEEEKDSGDRSSGSGSKSGGGMFEGGRESQAKKRTQRDDVENELRTISAILAQPEQDFEQAKSRLQGLMARGIPHDAHIPDPLMHMMHQITDEQTRQNNDKRQHKARIEAEANTPTRPAAAPAAHV